ncbi:hypothetical protein B0O99DRAFT_688390 [Bisporella sp. PMI_857]|nr:hypothetical protein B0O99DRAFT_688390 [Bisporella sp. PMI_857]
MVSLLFVLISLLFCHNAEAVYTGIISIPLDYFNVSDTRTFLNRYWMNDTFYQPAARLLANDGVLFATLELARRFNGIAIVWEYRFYGGTMPFAFNETTGVAFSGYDAYKYLNNELALEDAVFLAKNFQPPNMMDLYLRMRHHGCG